MAEATLTVSITYNAESWPEGAEEVAASLDLLMDNALSTEGILEGVEVGAFDVPEVESIAMTMQPESNEISFDANGVRVTVMRQEDGNIVVTVGEATGEPDDTGLTTSDS